MSGLDDLLPRLVDTQGVPYEAKLLRCVSTPLVQSLDDEQQPTVHTLWDAEALPQQHATARRLCRSCPALLPCRELSKRAGTRATGVWGGELIESTDDDGHDATVIRWAKSASVDLPARR